MFLFLSYCSIFFFGALMAYICMYVFNFFNPFFNYEEYETHKELLERENKAREDATEFASAVKEDVTQLLEASKEELKYFIQSNLEFKHRIDELNETAGHIAFLPDLALGIQENLDLALENIAESWDEPCENLKNTNFNLTGLKTSFVQSADEIKISVHDLSELQDNLKFKFSENFKKIEEITQNLLKLQFAMNPEENYLVLVHENQQLRKINQDLKEISEILHARLDDSLRFKEKLLDKIDELNEENTKLTQTIRDLSGIKAEIYDIESQGELETQVRTGLGFF